MTPAVPEFLVSRHTAAWLTAIMLAAALVATSHVVSPGAFIILPVLAMGGLALMRWPWLVVALLVASVPVQQVGAAVSGLLTVTRVSLVVTVSTPCFERQFRPPSRPLFDLRWMTKLPGSAARCSDQNRIRRSGSWSVWYWSE